MAYLASQAKSSGHEVFFLAKRFSREAFGEYKQWNSDKNLGWSTRTMNDASLGLEYKNIKRKGWKFKDLVNHYVR